MTTERIRPIAIGVIINDGRILAFEGYDPTKDQTYYRPPGGGIEFFEPSAQALIREFKEEMNADLCDVAYLGTVESIYEGHGRRGHEIVQVYSARLVDARFYALPEFIGHEDDGSSFKLKWISLDACRRDELILYPDGLLNLIANDEQKIVTRSL